MTEDTLQRVRDATEGSEERLDGWRDNFDRQVTNILTDLINVPGEHDFTPERLRYYKDGTRVFLEYGDDATYSESTTGHMLTPGSDQTLTLKLAERTAYPVGYDLWPSMAYQIQGTLSAGDSVGWGYGEIDLANFDPSTRTWSGSTADGYFIIHTQDTGLGEAFLLGVRDGTVWGEERITRNRAADVLSIIEARLNWYDVGPAVFRETYTNGDSAGVSPQVNRSMGAISADDGKAAATGSQRPQFSIHQATGNSGLVLEAGSMSIKSSGLADYQFKNKGHSMDLENTNTTRGTYQVCGAIRGDPDRPTVKLRIPEFEIISTPGTEVNWTRVMIISVDASETDISFPADHADAVPVEHSKQNSIVEEVEDNTATGPVEDDAGTDASGPTTANTMTNPGGYQLGRESVTPEGVGAQTTVTSGQQVGNRSVYDTDIALLLVDSDTAGTVEIDVTTEQNS